MNSQTSPSFDNSSFDNQFEDNQFEQSHSADHSAGTETTHAVDPLAATLAVATTSGIAGAAIGNFLGGRVGATIGAVVGGVAGATLSNDAARETVTKEATHAMHSVANQVKDVPERAKTLAGNVEDSLEPIMTKVASHSPALEKSVKSRTAKIAPQPSFSTQERFTLPATTHHRFGVALGRQGKLDAAMQEFQRAIALVPNSAAAHYNLGVALNKQGASERALEEWFRARDLCLEQGKTPQLNLVEQAIQSIQVG